ncbi:response regulator [Kineosporia succinea]
MVDDNATSRRALQSQLERWGLETLVADGPQAAVDLLAGGRPVQVALIDLQMPGMDGPRHGRPPARTAGRP